MKLFIFLCLFFVKSSLGSFEKDSFQCLEYLGLAWEYKYSDPDSSLMFVDTAIHLSEKHDNNSLKAKSYYYKAIINYLNGNYEQTFQFVEISKPFYKKSNDHYGISSLYNLMGLVYEKIGSFESAISSYENSLEYANKTDNLYAQSNPIHNIGMLYEAMEKPEKALENYFKALKIREEISDTLLIGQSYLTISSALYLKNDFENSLKYSNKAIFWFEFVKPASLANIAVAKNNKAVVYNELKFYNKAEKLLDEAIIISKETDDVVNIVKCFINKADGYLLRNELKKASNYTDSVVLLSYENDIVYGIKKSLLLKKDIATVKGNYKKAFFYQNKLTAFKDSLNADSYLQQLSILNVKNRVAEYNEKIAVQEVTIIENKLKVKNKNILIGGIIGLGLFIISIGAFVIKQKNLKQEKLIIENKLKDEISSIKLKGELQNYKLRISNDLHDNIGAQLSFISSSINNLQFKQKDEKAKNKLRKIAEFSNQTITQLRETIWALNKENITLEDLEIKIINFINKAKLIGEHIEFQFLPELKSDYALSSIEGVSLFRIIQEAVNNAVKYSSASVIKLIFIETSGKLLISIIDNGIGFDITKIKMGNGLENMQKRAIQIGATFTLNSENGTDISIELLKK